MPLKPIPTGAVRPCLRDQLERLAKQLKAGECYPLTEVADEIGVALSNVHLTAKKAGLVSKQFSPGVGRNISVLINPKFQPKTK